MSSFANRTAVEAVTVLVGALAENDPDVTVRISLVALDAGGGRADLYGAPRVVSPMLVAFVGRPVRLDGLSVSRVVPPVASACHDWDEQGA